MEYERNIETRAKKAREARRRALRKLIKAHEREFEHLLHVERIALGLPGMKYERSAGDGLQTPVKGAETISEPSQSA